MVLTRIEQNLSKSSDFRDLVGNIVTTITCCLIVNQGAHLIKVFTELRNHTNFLVLGKLLFENTFKNLKKNNEKILKIRKFV